MDQESEGIPHFRNGAIYDKRSHILFTLIHREYPKQHHRPNHSGQLPHSCRCPHNPRRNAFFFGCNSQSVITSTGEVHVEIAETLINTAGPVRRCGRVRSELVLLLAAVMHLKLESVMEKLREFHLTEVVLVGA